VSLLTQKGKNLRTNAVFISPLFPERQEIFSLVARLVTAFLPFAPCFFPVTIPEHPQLSVALLCSYLRRRNRNAHAKAAHLAAFNSAAPGSRCSDADFFRTGEKLSLWLSAGQTKFAARASFPVISVVQNKTDDVVQEQTWFKTSVSIIPAAGDCKSLFVNFFLVPEL
jgi:hypothetical protein